MSDTQELMMQQLDRVNRLQRRRPHGRPGRGIERIFKLLKENGSTSTSTLCESLDIRPSSLNEVLARLELEGMIVKNRSEEDGRVWMISLSEKGEERLIEMEKMHQEMHEKFANILSDDEKETLTALLKKWNDGIEALQPPHHHDGHHPERRERKCHPWEEEAPEDF